MRVRTYLTGYILVPLILLAGLLPWASSKKGAPRNQAFHGERVMLVADQDYAPIAARLMAGAKKSIYLGILRIGGDRWPHRETVRQLVRELVEARRRGVRVHVKLNNSDYMPAEHFRSNRYVAALLKKEGINVLFDGRTKTLHSKFLIVDDDLSLVWAGNWATSSLDVIHDLGILVQSRSVAKELIAYWKAIPVMPPSPANVETPDDIERALGEKKNLWSGLPPMDTWLWVEDFGWTMAEDRNYLPLLLELIENAESSIIIGQSELNYSAAADGMPRIVKALRAAAARGVDIRIVLKDSPLPSPKYDMGGSPSPNPLVNLRSWGMNAEFGKRLHSKFLVVDDRYSVIGSTNWCTGAVDYSHELSFVVDSREISRQTRHYWEGISRVASRGTKTPSESRTADGL